MTLLAELGVWWAVAVGLWLASLSAYSTHDLVVAAGCGVPCAVVAAAGRRALRGRWRLPAAAVGWLLALPAQVVRDAARVLALPLRQRANVGLRTIEVAATGGAPRATGRRAAVALVLSATPATFVVAADDDRGTFLVHAVGPAGRLERAVRR